MEAVWFTALFSSICLEGLGRKYMPGIPAIAFYFLKDIVLVLGFVLFRPSREVTRTTRRLYGAFGLIWVIGLVWTAIEMFNPTETSALLGLVGFRAYWLWWFAPGIIAEVIKKERVKRHAIYVLVVMSIGISALAVVQFFSPPTSSLNHNTVVDGEALYAGDVAVISTTGHARVASTFAFLTGFQDFTTLVPTLLLALGLEAKSARVRNAALLGTLAAAAALPMSGSRASVLVGGAVLVIAAWTSGLLFTRIGRRIMVGGALAAVLSVTLFPDAFLGVESRFQDQAETESRYFAALEAYLPPLAMTRVDAPFIGIGTGTQQNAHISLRVALDWNEESEAARYLIELGPIGLLAVWLVKLGLMIALFKAAKILKKTGRRGAAAAAMSYGVLTFNGNLVFDHVWQALYFVGCGFILAEVVSATRVAQPVATAEAHFSAAPALAAQSAHAAVQMSPGSPSTVVSV